MNKPFDQQLLDENDSVARAWCKFLLMTKGYEAFDNPDKFEIDVIGTKGEKTWFFEGEVKKEWTGDFKYKTVHIPCRKEKYIRRDVVFVIVSGDRLQAFTVRADIVKECPKVEVPNKYVENGELFYDVPVEQCTLYKISKQ